VQQNTARGFGFAGLLVGAPTQDGPLLFAPVLPGLTFDGVPASFAAGPRRADLFGAFRDASGRLITGGAAARAPFLTASPLAPAPTIRINACNTAGGGCSPAVETGPFQRATSAENALALLTEVPLVTSENQSFVSLPTPEGDDEERDDGIASPITGSGNEDLWTTPVEDPAP
jgi:hypothetical protein